ncbi:uncharacterized protein LOC126361562 [Schistocerca gregaria]|uniref:uncharacterized protein LOC126361562 n=1 Tax=Schistocerca gregaria TaxID=7010 RepID=UPI00211F42F8|nr:uncharacterized protein LOC126361562 [Schistocerca gregaria]
MMERRKIHILRLSETKCKGKNSKLLRGGYKIYRQDHNKEAKNGGVFVFLKVIDLVTDVSFVSERIIRTSVNSGKNSFTTPQVYTHQQGCSEEEKTKFLEILEDQNTDRNGYDEVMGPSGYGRRNVEGEEMLNLCIRNHLLVKNTFFKKQEAIRLLHMAGMANLRQLYTIY